MEGHKWMWMKPEQKGYGTDDVCINVLALMNDYGTDDYGAERMTTVRNG